MNYNTKSKYEALTKLFCQLDSYFTPCNVMPEDTYSAVTSHLVSSIADFIAKYSNYFDDEFIYYYDYYTTGFYNNSIKDADVLYIDGYRTYTNCTKHFYQLLREYFSLHDFVADREDTKECVEINDEVDGAIRYLLEQLMRWSKISFYGARMESSLGSYDNITGEYMYLADRTNY